MLHKVLIVVSRDDYREGAYELAEGLRQYGYSPSFCRADVPSAIMADKLLDQETTLSWYDGVVFMDDGGDLKSAVALAKRAWAGELVVAGRRRGLWALHKAGLLGEGVVCSGMPREFYRKGSKQAKSKSVRSDKLVTSMSQEVGEFVIMCLDALGGKIKKVVRSSNSKKATEFIDNKVECAKWLSETCSAEFEVVDGLTADMASVAARLMLDGSRYIRFAERGRAPFCVMGRGNKAIVSFKLGDRAVHKIMTADQIADMFSGEKFMIQDSLGGSHIGDLAFESYIVMAKGPNGWEKSASFARGGIAVPGDVFCSLEPALDAMYPGESEARMTSVLAAAEAACITLQAALDDEGFERLGVSVVFDGEQANVVDVDHGDTSNIVLQDGRVCQIAKKVGKLVVAQVAADMGLHRRLLERELANEGVWLQPDGKVAIERRNTIIKLAIEDAISELVMDSEMATQREAEEKKSGKPGRAKLLARRSRHKLNLARDLAKMLALSPTKTASSLYPSGVQGWHANLDLPMFERVIPLNQNADNLKDRDKAISELPRYGPEYKRTSPDDQYGMYYVYYEPANDPFKFDDRDSEDPYKRRTQLEIC